MRFRDGNTDGDLIDEGDDTLYYCHDANFNVTALIDTGGTVAKRYTYHPYGKAYFYEPDWTIEGGGTRSYDNEDWQVLEVRKDSDTDPLRQYVWDPRHIGAQNGAG